MIALPLKFRLIRGMTIAAGHTGMVHFALDERTVDKYLIQDLTISIVKPLVQQRGDRVVEQIRPGTESFGYLITSALTRSANIH